MKKNVILAKNLYLLEKKLHFPQLKGYSIQT